MLYRYTFRDNEIDLIISVANSLFSDEDIKKDFSTFVRETVAEYPGESTKLSKHLWKVSSGEKVRDHRFCALVCDYLSTSPFTRKQEESFQGTIASQIKELTQCIESRNSSELKTPFQYFARDTVPCNDLKKVPQQLLGEFIGYRLGAQGQIFRSYFNIFLFENEHDEDVYYKSSYRHAGKNWQEEGYGRYSMDTTLTLLGQSCVDEKVNGGFSAYALKCIAGGEFVLGQVQARDDFGPVSARTLFIPLRLHKKALEQEKLAHFDFLDALIETPNSLEEIENNVGYLFGNEGIKVLFKYISNTTSATLGWMPDFNYGSR